MLANDWKEFCFYLGVVAGFILPLFNIPLAWKIYKLKSAKNISFLWAVGVWICVVLILPQVLLSPDWSYKIFGIVNFILFSIVFFLVCRFRKQ